MITDIADYLRYFGGIHRRTVRDVSSLPPETEEWRPPAREGEAGWGIPDLVRHIAEARLFFASAYTGRGWVWDPWPDPMNGREAWPPTLERSAERLMERLDGTPREWLSRKVEAIGDEGVMVSGWRLLMMLTEHEVHHRAQISTYAGLNGWPVRQTFDRTNEWVVSRRQAELQKGGRAGEAR